MAEIDFGLGVSAPNSIAETEPLLNNFENRATYMAVRGVKITPVLPGMKRAFLPAWQQSATRDLQQIKEWAKRFPNHNVGVVARYDSLWLLDADDPTLAERYERDTNEIFPQTFAVESSPGHRHYYFRPTAASRALDNVSQDRVRDRAFSVRANNEYVVGPGSIHPSGAIYRIVDDSGFVDVPNALIDWINTQVVEHKTAAPEPKPTVDAQPQTQNGNATAKKVHEGGRNSFLASRAGELWRVGISYEGLCAELPRINEKMCVPPLDDSEVLQIAKSISGYEQPADEQIEVVTEPLPALPTVPGSLGNFCEALCADIPRDYRIMAAFTHIGLMLSGKVKLENEQFIQPRFYTCLIGAPNSGKSAAINDVSLFLFQGFKRIRSVDSGPALVETFFELAEETIDTEPVRALLAPDEMRDAFEKAKQVTSSRNSLFDLYLTLFQENVCESRTVGRGTREVPNAHFAMLAGATPGGYEQMWAATGGSSSGLQSRFVLAASDRKMPAVQAPWDEKEARSWCKKIYEQIASAPAAIKISPESIKLLEDWWAGVPQLNTHELRLQDMVKRILIVLAVTNDVGVIEPWLMRVGIEFGNYQLALRQRYNPSDSWTWVQDAEEKIMSSLRKFGSLSKNNIRRLVHASRLKGGLETFNRAIRAMQESGAIEIAGHTRKNNPVFALIE